MTECPTKIFSRNHPTKMRIVSTTAATKNVEGGAAVLLTMRILVGRLHENIFVGHSGICYSSSEDRSMIPVINILLCAPLLTTRCLVEHYWHNLCRLGGRK